MTSVMTEMLENVTLTSDAAAPTPTSTPGSVTMVSALLNATTSAIEPSIKCNDTVCDGLLWDEQVRVLICLL